MMTLYVSPYNRAARMSRRLEERTSTAEYSAREKVLAVDVKADEEAYTISALIPGIEAEEINVEILKNTVSIRGEFNDSEENEKEEILVSELPAGRFRRELTMPAAMDSSKADASLKNGVFTLRVPKAEVDRPKMIKINTN
ncbi:MAG: Hsp20/alpha crystallin family protein [Anaerolineales bacterium]